MQRCYYQTGPMRLLLFCSPWMRHSIAFSLFFIFHLYFCSTAHRPECCQYFWCYAQPTGKSHQSTLHWGTDEVMKGLVSNWKVLLGDAPCLCLNAIYVFSVMKWMIEIDLLVKSADVAKRFPFWKVWWKFTGPDKLERCADQWFNLIKVSSKPNLRKS